MKEIFLLKLGEIVLKGANRRTFEETLKKNVTVLKNNPSMNVILGSHTDERGTTEYNLALSQKRGNSVKEHAQSMGIDGSRMSVVPYGKEKPASIGSREQDYALNRRVEFIKR